MRGFHILIKNVSISSSTDVGSHNLPSFRAQCPADTPPSGLFLAFSISLDSCFPRLHSSVFSPSFIFVSQDWNALAVLYKLMGYYCLLLFVKIQ